MKDEYKEVVCRVRFIDGAPAQAYLSDVEIVRCKDCYWYDEDGTCVRYSFLSKPTDYCSNGERKEE